MEKLSNGKVNARRGVSMIDVMFALTISALMLAGLIQIQSDTNRDMTAESIADNMTNIGRIASTYIQNNYSTLNSQIPVGSQAVEIPISNDTSFMGIGDLSTVASLPSNYQANLPMGQKLHFLVRNVSQSGNAPQHLEGMLVTTGSQQMGDRAIGMALNKMGTSGGGIMARPPAGQSTNVIQGAFGGWSYPATQWQTASGVAPTAGHVMMTLNSVSPQTSVYLSRYNMGNSDYNRMHTSIDMNGNSILNVSDINGVNGSDININTDGDQAGRVIMGNGGVACYNNQAGCHFDVSNDGGFYDNGDNWVTFQGTNGLKIAGGGNLETDGVHYAQGGLYTSDSRGIAWSANPTLNAQGTLPTTDAQMTYANGWLSAGGASGFQGISTNILQASRFQDSSNNNYYVVPSGFSHMNNLQLAGHLSTNNMDPNGGYPALPTEAGGGAISGGVHTYDVYAEGGLYAGNINGQATIALMSNGSAYFGGNLYMTNSVGSGGNIQANGRIATNGLDPNASVAGWGGGIHTLDVVAENGIALESGGQLRGEMRASDGSLDMSGVVAASVFRPKSTHRAGDSCANVDTTTVGGGGNPGISAGSGQLGDIAKTSEGNILTCQIQNGNMLWEPAANQFGTFMGCNGSTSLYNDPGTYGGGSLFVTSIMNGSHDHGDIEAYVNGIIVSSYGNGSKSGTKHWTTSAIVPPGASYSVSANSGIASTCIWK